MSHQGFRFEKSEFSLHIKASISAVQNQKGISVYFTSKMILPSAVNIYLLSQGIYFCSVSLRNPDFLDSRTEKLCNFAHSLINEKIAD